MAFHPSNELVAAALTASMKSFVPIRTQSQGNKGPTPLAITEKGENPNTLNLQNLHQLQLPRGPVHFSSRVPPSNEGYLTIHVKTLTGTSYTIGCRSSDTVQVLKVRIQDLSGISTDQQRLIHAGRQLHDEDKLISYKILDGDTLHLAVSLIDEESPVVYLPENFLDPLFDCDFTNRAYDGRVFNRGGYKYHRPYGWFRTAIYVLDKYEDDAWLGVGKRRNAEETVHDEWPVSYHGTALHNMKTIAEEGYDLTKGKRFQFGYGIYTAPDIRVAELYATEFTFENHNYKMVMQNRVNPKTLKKIGKEDTKIGEYWLSKNQEDVRPYGICIKSCGPLPVPMRQRKRKTCVLQ